MVAAALGILCKSIQMGINRMGRSFPRPAATVSHQCRSRRVPRNPESLRPAARSSQVQASHTLSRPAYFVRHEGIAACLLYESASLARKNKVQENSLDSPIMQPYPYAGFSIDKIPDRGGAFGRATSFCPSSLRQASSKRFRVDPTQAPTLPWLCVSAHIKLQMRSLTRVWSRTHAK